MFKAAVLALLATSASAFVAKTGPVRSAPVARTAAKGSVSMFDPRGELGVLRPVGFFDPLGLSKGIDEEKFNRWRTVEIKHGRVCMMAFVGFIWQQGVGHFPGYISHSPDLKFADIPDGVAAIGAVPGVGWAQILWFAGLLELGMFSVKTQRAPGAFNFYRPGGPELGGYPGVTDENRAQKLTIELQNGRLAMLGVIGILMGDVVTPDQAGIPFPLEDGIGLF
uniref:Plastid light harvesting protein n=1 Tax=Florenciella parvula TaxID=236787 RepID=A0A7S2FNH5_9STRA|mmetsp:Transcript_19666/g.41303  ORF Transcript_19666/g.41303 Transcript_19666/m.41303 type:complete len:223 (+) Transcript_19666:35-703(+)